MLLWKFQMGCSTIRTSIPMRLSASSGAVAIETLALEAARETITLLKNDGGVLPLDPRR